MTKRPRPDMNQVRDAMRQRAERQEEEPAEESPPAEDADDAGEDED
jgi:hypothetical protein